MKISQILAQSRQTYPSIEIVPPLEGISREQLLDGIRPFMEFNPRYINVTCHRDEYEFRQNPDGSFSRFPVRRRVSESAVCGAIQSEFGVDVVPHLICAGASAKAIESQLQDFRFMDICNVLALRGDSVQGEKRFVPEIDGYAHAEQLVSAIHEFEQRNNCQGFFSTGVGGYPEKHFEAPNLQTDIEYLKAKVSAGADYIITQMFFDNQRYYDFVDSCRAASITVPIIPGLKPLTSARQLNLIPQAFSVDIPLELSAQIAAHADNPQACREIGQQWCIAQSKDLIAHGVPAIHYYTMGKASNVVNILKECF